MRLPVVAMLMVGPNKKHKPGKAFVVESEGGSGVYTKAGRDWAMITCLNLGIAPKVVAQSFQTSNHTVKAVHKKWLEEGVVGVRPGRGRKRKLSSEDIAPVVEAFTKREITSLCSIPGVDLGKACRNTWLKALREVLGRMVYTPRTKKSKSPALNQSDKKKRVEFAHTMLARFRERGSGAYLQQLVFSDSKVFTSFKLTPNGVWRVEAVDPSTLEKAGPPSKTNYKVHAYGAICWHGGSRLIIDISGTHGKVVVDFDADGNPTKIVKAGHADAGTRRGVNGEEYRRHILPKMLKDIAHHCGRKKFVWQQDGAKPHTLSDNTPAGKECKTIIKGWAASIMGWPAKSPDLSLIENVWSRMEQMMLADKRKYKSHDEFASHVIETWAKLMANKEYREGLFQSFPVRLGEVIALKGEKTPH